MTEALRIEGIVVRLHGRTCWVQSGEREYECSMRGRLKQGRRRQKSLVAVGDAVVALLDPDSAGSIEEVKPRRTELIRHTPHSANIKHVIAANVDQMFVVIAADQAKQNLVGLDKLLAAGVMQNLAPIILVNKCELCDVRAIFTPYKAAGFEALYVSARTGEGLEALRARLANTISVFVGASGVGKTSLLNALEPSLELRVGDVDRRGEGRHTTTSATLLRVAAGRVVDTPGLREFGLTNFNTGELSLFYPDFAAFREKCKFATCTHRHEPKCAVRTAVEQGLLDAGRYERYLSVLREAWNTEQRQKP